MEMERSRAKSVIFCYDNGMMNMQVSRDSIDQEINTLQSSCYFVKGEEVKGEVKGETDNPDGPPNVAVLNLSLIHI